ncbi:MAG: hypothetical protein DRP97_04425 [Candidatus Latescibacterota bacterium]|nr:MAG: hypothetical protein DRP97_04425 [Candidatus Latescibacterota bacterium]
MYSADFPHRKDPKHAKNPPIKVLKCFGFFRVFRGGNTKIILSGNLEGGRNVLFEFQEMLTSFDA